MFCLYLVLWVDLLTLSCASFLRLGMSLTTVLQSLQYQKTLSLQLNSYSSSLMLKQSVHVQTLTSVTHNHLAFLTSMMNFTNVIYPRLLRNVLIRVSNCAYSTNISTFRHVTSVCAILGSFICGSYLLTQFRTCFPRFLLLIFFLFFSLLLSSDFSPRI